MQDFAAHSIGQIAPQTILYEGRYRIDLLLAAAPTRAVYRAWDLTQHRPATILELATPDAATAAAALQQAAPLVQLNHAALTPIQVIFVEHGTFFLALALAGGQTIERIMAERANPITPAAAVRWIAQAAEGVEFLDQALPTWHIGDLSPAALLVTAEDRVQLLGFEVALGLLSPQALTAALPPGTVAQELATGLCDARSDVYGLAATLYFLLTRQRWSAQRESLANARPDLSRALVATVMRGLAEQPTARWPDAATFYQELLRSLPINHPSQRGAPWWDEDQAPLDGLAEEPPTLITTRDQLRAAVAAQQAALDSAATDETPTTPALNTTTAPIDTYIVMSPEIPRDEAAIPATPPDENTLAAAEAEHIAPPLEAFAATETAQHDDATTQLAADTPAVAAPTAVTPITFAAPTESVSPTIAPTIPDAPADGSDEIPDQQDAPAGDNNNISEQQDSASPPADASPDDSVMPEPVAATIIRPRWAWSDMSDDTPITVIATPASEFEPAQAEANTPGTLEDSATTTATPQTEASTTPTPSDDAVAPSPALTEPVFADTFLRWPQQVIPETAIHANGSANAEPDEQAATPTQTTASFAPALDSQSQADSVDDVDLTALPTQIKAADTTEAAAALPDYEPAALPAYSPWDMPPPTPAQNLAGEETAVVNDTMTPHLALDEDIVAAAPSSLAPDVATPTNAAPDTATAERAFPTTPTPLPPVAEAEQVIVAHSDYMSSEPPPVDPPKTSKTPSRPLGSGLLDRLRGILHTPGPMPALATGTVVVPRHMYPQHTYSVLVRVQCRPATTTPGEPAKKEATFIIVEVEAPGDAFYVPVRRLALRLPNEGGLSEGTFTITALRPSVPNETDPITFTFRSVDNQLLHDGQFLAEINILSPQQLAGGNPMLTLVHALDIEQTLA